jgi:hypothetical protein
MELLCFMEGFCCLDVVEDEISGLLQTSRARIHLATNNIYPKREIHEDAHTHIDILFQIIYFRIN